MDQEPESTADVALRKRKLLFHLRHYGQFALALTLVLTIALTLARSLQASPTLISPISSCAELAALDPTATNGPTWGRTILKGFGAADGWFGVDVCSNGSGAINVSCDKTPTSWGSAGCAPGQPSGDGYGWTFQCPELIKRFGAWAFGDNPNDWGGRFGGDAPDLWLDGNHPSTYVMYANGSKQAPMPGDILIWGYLDSAGQPWPAGPDGSHSGHIAVVAAVRNGIVVTAEQNVAWGGEDHPSDTLALTATPTGWILSGSTTPTTTLPTYRWQRTMGAARATYGWLHSTKNTGRFQKTGVAPATPPPPPPSLSGASVVTADGALVDLAWTQLPASPDAVFLSTPVAAARRLGAPPGVTLRPDLAPATLVSADSRSIATIDTKGRLWEARTASAYMGVVWRALDAPPGIRLDGAPSLVPFADGALVSALGDDGALWWRSEAGQNLGPWTSLGHSATASFAGTALTLSLPGTSQLLAVALGADGRIYQAQWRDFNGSGDESAHTRGWTEWTAIEAALEGRAARRIRLTGNAPQLVAVVEPGGVTSTSSAVLPPTVDLFALDNSGSITWLRGAGDPSTWRAAAIDAPSGATSLLGATTLDGFLGATALSHIEQLYLATDTGVSMASLTMPGGDAAAIPTITWSQFARQEKATHLTPAGSALRIGPGASALLMSADDHALTVAAPEAIGILSGAPAPLSSTNGASATAPPTWFDAGAATAGKPFSDDLTATTLDPRWQLAPSSAQALASASGVRLASQQDGTAATLIQGMTDDTESMVVKVSGLESGARAGLTLRFDDDNWVTLTTDRAGADQFCPNVNRTLGACQSTKTTPGAGGALWLKLTRADGQFMASASVDGAQWNQFGSWSAPAPPASQTATQDESVSSVWLPFTSAGLLVTGAPDGAHAPVFTSLQVEAAPARISGA
jgi:hypothetical protein